MGVMMIFPLTSRATSVTFLPVSRSSSSSQVFVTVIDYKTSKVASSLNELKKDMQLLVYTLAVNELYGSKPVVGDWFLRTNTKVFFKPEDQTIEALKTELADLAAKIKAAQFEPKESWECNHCDYKCLCD
jgi:RecB family exonuclease